MKVQIVLHPWAKEKKDNIIMFHLTTREIKLNISSKPTNIHNTLHLPMSTLLQIVLINLSLMPNFNNTINIDNINITNNKPIHCIHMLFQHPSSRPTIRHQQTLYQTSRYNTSYIYITKVNSIKVPLINLINKMSGKGSGVIKNSSLENIRNLY